MGRPAYLFLFLLSVPNRKINSQGVSETDNKAPPLPIKDNRSFDDQECSVYIAQSSIPGAGFGIFTTRDLLKESDIVPYSDAPSIIICDYHYFDMDSSDWIHPNYVWHGNGFANFECESVSENVMTIGAITNLHTYLANMEGTCNGYDDEAVNRFTDPSAGSFSYHKGRCYTAKRNITAGEEIFADYGRAWLDGRAGTYADHIPRYDEFVTASSILNITKNNFQKSTVAIDDRVLSVIKDVAEIFNEERIASLIPNAAAEFDNITQNPENTYANSLAKKTVVNREVKWIKDNGLCMDNIVAGKSSLPQVGQGGFAKRFLAEGNIIVPAPLIQIMNRDHLLMYDIGRDEETKELKIGYEPTGSQLLTNYCFGHRDSKILLCPQSNAILINHCSSRRYERCGAHGPNAKIQWASGWDPDTPAWLKMSLNQLASATEKQTRGLSLEFIATRDIEIGEEIFIDYGPNWEDAWESHKNTWEPPVEVDGFKSYIPLMSMIGKAQFRTVDELEVNPYPDNIINACYWYEYKSGDYNPDERGYYDAHEYIYEGDLKETVSLYRCDLLKRLSDTYYEVRVWNKLDEVLLTKYPKESITFRMKKYSTDQYLPKAFRHFIEIEDSIFPEQWRHINTNKAT